MTTPREDPSVDLVGTKCRLLTVKSTRTGSLRTVSLITGRVG
jgi:hypothetical protein